MALSLKQISGCERNSEEARTMPEFTCQLSETGSPLTHFWEHTVGSDHAPVALRADWQNQLRRCHESWASVMCAFMACSQMIWARSSLTRKSLFIRSSMETKFVTSFCR